MRRRRRPHARSSLAATLYGLAGVAAARGEFEAAARMLGAAEALEQQLGEEVDQIAQEAYTETTASVLRHRDEPAIAAAWAEGKTMSDTEAAAYALATVAERAPL